MAVYNLSNVTDTSNTILDIVVALNETSSGLIGILSLLVIFLLVFIATKGADTKASFLASSFVSSIIAIGFLYTGFIGFHIVIYPFIIFLASLLIYLWKD